MLDERSTRRVFETGVNVEASREDVEGEGGKEGEVRIECLISSLRVG